MRIIFVGIPEFGTICLQAMMEAKKNIVAILLPPKSHPTYKPTILNAKRYNIPIIKIDKGLKNPELIEEIKNYKPDLMMIASYPRLIPSEIYSIFPLGAINCHPSLLPHYRGANPYFYVIRHGCTETGITFHYLDESFDTGDIIAQWKVPIRPDETLGNLYIRLSIESSDLYLKVLEKIQQEGKLVGHPQPENVEGLFDCKEVDINSSDLRVNWSESANSIDCLVRACNPYFGAITIYRNMPLKLWSGIVLKKSLKLRSNIPGTIVKVAHDELIVATGDGFYSPTCLQFGMLYTCDIREFIKRNNPKVGELLN